MASKNQNLSALANSEELASAVSFKVAVVVAQWNKEVTGALLEGALSTLQKAGCEDVKVVWVPGAFELPLGAQMVLERDKTIDGVVTLGCVIRGGTPHFEYVSQGTTLGIMDVQLKYNKPVTFGLLTVDDMQQALDRCGGVHGNKGDEAAATLVEMLNL